MANFRASAEYGLINHFAVGAAVNCFNLNVDVKDNEWRGAADYEYFGPQLFISTRF